MKQFNPPHPGEILKEEIMIPLKLEPRDVADKTGISEETIKNIIEGKDSITSEIASKFSNFFSTSDQFWLRLQSEYDDWKNAL